MDKTPIQLFTTQQQQLLLLLKAIEQQTLRRQADHDSLIDQLQANQTSITATLDAVSDNAAASQSASLALLKRALCSNGKPTRKKQPYISLNKKQSNSKRLYATLAAS
ncbi:hypothetical protein JCM19237_2871 [Photobacterium aphoticum]|uniref:Uncharacterized protein n=1 Tax=Photobacterium aphoticum TaxID=754436 RepID=A0A090RLD5_9GAMM|nr:hypothetical protein JCM19237_2871 [Photobacterium aphoticum]